jgi:hypothetical protein
VLFRDGIGPEITHGAPALDDLEEIFLLVGERRRGLLSRLERGPRFPGRDVRGAERDAGERGQSGGEE